MKTFLKSISLFLAMLFVAPAFAQTVGLCDAYGATTKIGLSAVPVGPITQTPKSLGGTASWPFIYKTEKGIASGYYTYDGFSYSYQLQAATNEKLLDPALYTDWMAVQLASDKAAALNEFAKKHITLELTDPILLEVWCPALDRIVAARPPVTPYIVSPYPGATYRSTYTLDKARNGVRNTTSVGKVYIVTPASGSTPAAATPCNCITSRLIEGSTTYCSVMNAPLTVAACKPK